MACGHRVGVRHTSSGEGPKPEPTRCLYRRLERLGIDELPVPAVGHCPPTRAVSYAVDQLDRAEEGITRKVGQGRSEDPGGLQPLSERWGEVATEQMNASEAPWGGSSGRRPRSTPHGVIG